MNANDKLCDIFTPSHIHAAHIHAAHIRASSSAKMEAELHAAKRALRRLMQSRLDAMPASDIMSQCALYGCVLL